MTFEVRDLVLPGLSMTSDSAVTPRCWSKTQRGLFPAPVCNVTQHSLPDKTQRAAAEGLDSGARRQVLSGELTFLNLLREELPRAGSHGCCLAAPAVLPPPTARLFRDLGWDGVRLLLRLRGTHPVPPCPRSCRSLSE